MAAGGRRGPCPPAGRGVTNVVLVRHGETVWHAENRYAGRTDVALSELGREQAERLAARLRDGGLAAIWASPLGRAAETAAAVVRATGLAPWSDERLRELDFGTAEGLTRDEMAERFPGALRAFDEDPVANHLPEGEDPRAAAARGVACLEDVAAAHLGARACSSSPTRRSFGSCSASCSGCRWPTTAGASRSCATARSARCASAAPGRRCSSSTRRSEVQRWLMTRPCARGR
jgi:broad specificity phosphatase PhoE